MFFSFGLCPKYKSAELPVNCRYGLYRYDYIHYQPESRPHYWLTSNRFSPSPQQCYEYGLAQDYLVPYRTQPLYSFIHTETFEILISDTRLFSIQCWCGRFLKMLSSDTDILTNYISYVNFKIIKKNVAENFVKIKFRVNDVV
jgi:hypothetical protein